MITRQFNLIILFVLICCALKVNATEQQGEAYLLKAVFIYNFAKFTRWPEEAWKKNGHSLRICSAGDDNLVNTLAKLHGRTLRDHPVIIEQLHDTKTIDVCHVLYLANSLHNKTLETVDSIHSKPILAISELPGFAKSGGMIELYQKEDRIRFKINLKSIRKAGLDISSRLLKLADIVIR